MAHVKTEKRALPVDTSKVRTHTFRFRPHPASDSTEGGLREEGNRTAAGRRNGGAAEGVEGGVCQVRAGLVQVVQVPNRQGPAPSRQDGSGVTVRRLHARS